MATQGKSCACVANGDKLGKFASRTAEDESACDVQDIGKLKILCAWKAPGITSRTPASE